MKYMLLTKQLHVVLQKQNIANELLAVCSKYTVAHNIVFNASNAWSNVSVFSDVWSKIL